MYQLPGAAEGTSNCGLAETPLLKLYAVIALGRRRAELGVELIDVGRGAVLKRDQQRLRRGHAHREELGLPAAGQRAAVRRSQASGW